MARVLSKSEMKFSPNQYGGSMAALTVDGNFAFGPLTCKEEFYYSICKNVAFWKSRNCEYMDLLLGDPSFGKIDRRRPRFVYFVGAANADSLQRIADRVEYVITLLCKKMNVSDPRVFYTPSGHGIVCELPSIFIKSPYATSAVLTFIRGAAHTVFDFETLDDFITELTNEHVTDNDGYHLSSAIQNHTLDAFFEKRLPCMKHRGFDGYRRGIETASGFELHGIATYHSSRDIKDYTKISASDIRRMYNDGDHAFYY